MSEQVQVYRALWDATVAVSPDGSALTAGKLADVINDLLAEVENLRQSNASMVVEIERLRTAGRYVTAALAAASDDSEDRWTGEEVYRIFEKVCKRWPELDPRRPH